MLAPENRADAIDFMGRVAEAAGEMGFRFRDPEANAAAELLLRGEAAKARAAEMGAAEKGLVDAGQQLVDGLFGKESGIKVREGTAEEAAEVLGEASGKERFSLAPSPLGDGKQKYYEVPFDKAVDKIVANRKARGRNAKLISNDAVFVGETPDVLSEIGFVKLPIMMTQHHIETCYFTKQNGLNWHISGHMHGLGDLLKKVPEALKEPVMVIASRSPKGKDTSVVEITSIQTPEGDMILPVAINGEPNVDGGRITANIVTSAHGRKNAWTGLVKEAIETENKGSIGIFYMDNAKASKVFASLAKANPQLASAGLKYAKKPQASGLVHSIHDPGSPVKAQAEKISSQTETRQFKKWFEGSKVVDADGKPLVVYRGAGFDPLAQEAGKGVIKPEAYFTADPEYAKRYGKVGAYYLNIRNPFDIRKPECLAELKKAYPDHEFQRGKSGALDWAEASVIDAEFLKENFGEKYDGIIYDEGGDPTGEGARHRGISYVPLEGGKQVKSATDNIGTFDPNNADIRYELKDAAGQVKGWFDRGTGEVVLMKGADIRTVAHEIGWHAVRQWAEKNSPELLSKMNEYAASCPKSLRRLIEKRYKGFTGEALIDEIGAGRFERELGDEFRKLLETRSQVRSWWQKVCDAIRKMLRGFIGKGDGIDLKKMKKMSPEEAMKWLAGQMMEGKGLAERSSASGSGKRPAIAGESGARNMGIKDAGEAKAMEEAGADREEDVPENRQIKRFSIRSFSDGTPFVEVDNVPDEIRKETDQDALRTKVEALIRSRWMNQIIDPQGVRAFVNGRTAHEYVKPAKPLTDEELRAKMNAAGNLDEVVATSGNARAVPDGKDGHVHENVKGWEHRDAIFRVDGRFWAGRVNIAILDKVAGKKGDFRKLHDLTGLKEITDEVWRLHGDPVEDGQSYPSNIGDNADNIPHLSDEIKSDPENAQGGKRPSIGSGTETERREGAEKALKGLLNGRRRVIEPVNPGAAEAKGTALNAAADREAELMYPEMSPSEDPSMAQPVTMGLSELVRMYRAMSGGAMPKVLARGLRGERHGRWRNGKAWLAADVFGIVDRSDLERIKEELKKEGRFRHEDPQWAATHTKRQVEEMRDTSEMLLEDRITTLADNRVHGKNLGGNRSAINAMAHEIGRLVCEMPVDGAAPERLRVHWCKNG